MVWHLYAILSISGTCVLEKSEFFEYRMYIIGLSVCSVGSQARVQLISVEDMLGQITFPLMFSWGYIT